MSGAETLYGGLKLAELLTLVGIIIGPIVAVIISLWVEARRRVREQKLTLLRMLVSTRHLPSDPSYTVAINLIPVEFNKDKLVMIAYREFIEAVNVKLDGGVNDDGIVQKSTTKSIRLIFEICGALGFPIRETDLQTTAYAADGWIKRDNILVDSQKAMRDIATLLMLQSRLLAGTELTSEERTFIGVQEIKH